MIISASNEDKTEYVTLTESHVSPIPACLEFPWVGLRGMGRLAVSADSTKQPHCLHENYQLETGSFFSFEKKFGQKRATFIRIVENATFPGRATKWRHVGLFFFGRRNNTWKRTDTPCLSKDDTLGTDPKTPPLGLVVQEVINGQPIREVYRFQL